MIIKVIIAWLLLNGSPDQGYSSRYDEYVMTWQVEYHNLIPPCPDCAIAISDCSKIGDIVLIRPQGVTEWTPVVIADCAGNDGTPQWMAENHIILELSYGLAERFGALKSIPIEMLQ